MKKTLHNPVFRSILISYFAVCMILLAITGIGCVNSAAYVKREIENSASLQIREVVSQVENRIQQTYKICDTLAEGKALKEIAKIEGEFTPEQIMKTVELRNTMSRSNIQHNLYQNLYVYFCNSNSIVSEQGQRRSGGADMEMFCKEYGITLKKFQSILSIEEGKYWQILNDNRVWFLRPVYGENEKVQSVIIAEFNGENLIENLRDEDTVFIETNKGNISCAGDLNSADFKTLLDTDREVQEITAGKRGYVAIKQGINLFGWTCHMAVPNNLFWSEMRHFQGVMLSEILVLLAVAVLGSWYFSKRTYIPIGILMNDNKKLSKKVDKSEQILKNVELTRYLSGEMEEQSGICQLIGEQVQGRENDCYMMAVVTMGKESRQIFGENAQISEKNLELFVLENILEEQLFSLHKGILIPVKKTYAVVIHAKKEEEYLKKVRKIFRNVTEFYKENFGISMCVMMSHLFCEITEMKSVFDQLMDGLLYMDFWKVGEDTAEGVYLYGEMIETDENVNFAAYLNGSRKLLNCLESGDFPGAYQELDIIYRETFSRDQKHMRYNVYRMYGLIGILITTLDTYASKADREFFQSLCYEERLFRIQSMNELLSESRKIFENIIQYKESQAKEGEPEWLADLLSYIDSHYQDDNMNVSSLADTFGISVPHLSRTFKSVMEKGVLEYIHRIRIEHAKEMLKNGGNIKNVAPQAGYTDAKAFTRAFKRYEGITPSQYRELISKIDT